MKDLLIKILSLFNKATLATIVAIMGIYIAKIWYGDYKESQKRVIDKQEHIIKLITEKDKNRISSDSMIIIRLDTISDRQVLDGMKIDELKKAQDETVKRRLDDIESTYKQMKHMFNRGPMPELIEKKTQPIENNYSEELTMTTVADLKKND